MFTTHPAGHPLLILGGSVRAAVRSALRAGFTPLAGDYFGDADLHRSCPAQRAVNYPDDLFAIADAAPDAPWMYTGALENYPELVDRISSRRKLLGHDGATLRRIRDPLRLFEALERHQIACPPWRMSGEGLPRDGQWLRKGRISGGGLQVQPWDQRNRAAADDPQFYFQQKIPGRICGAIYVGDGEQARFLGASWQLAGADWCSARGFRYSGSIGPLELTRPQHELLQKLGAVLAAEMGLRGLFGVDLVLAADGGLWPFEVNPRYTASVEVLELALGLHAIGLHAEAWGAEVPVLPSPAPLPAAMLSGDALFSGLPVVATAAANHSASGSAFATPSQPIEPPPLREGACRGKAVVYARRNLRITRTMSEQWLERALRDEPLMGDIPHPGTKVPRGAPILTLFANGTTLNDTEQRLRSLVDQFYASLPDPRRRAAG